HPICTVVLRKQSRPCRRRRPRRRPVLRPGNERRVRRLRRARRMPGRIPRRSTTRLRGIFRAAKRKCRRPGPSCGAEFRRDARQNRVEGFSGKKEARPSARRLATGHLCPSLRDGYFLADAVRGGSETRRAAGSDRLRKLVTRGQPNLRPIADRASLRSPRVAGNVSTAQPRIQSVAGGEAIQPLCTLDQSALLQISCLGQPLVLEKLSVILNSTA